MDLRQLECFVAVAEELHFARAAQRLHMTQPPLSRQIRLLEQVLGVMLFERTSRSVQLTVAGKAFLRDARHLLQQSRAAALNVKRVAEGATGEVALGFTAVASYQQLPQLLLQARKRMPDVVFRLRELVSVELSRALLAGELDITLTRQFPHHQGLACIPLIREEMVLALHQDHPLAELETVSLRALNGQDFIGYTPDEGYYFHQRIAHALQSQQVSPQIIHQTAQTHTLLALVRAGLGIGIVPASACMLQLDELTFRPLRDNSLQAELFAVWHPATENPALQMFITLVLKPMATAPMHTEAVPELS